MNFGSYLDDLSTGQVFKHWPGKTVTESDNHLFCMLTFNQHPVHSDRHFAEHSSAYGKNLVVGTLVYSLVLGLSVADLSGRALGHPPAVDEVRHPNPVFHGDTIYAETVITDKERVGPEADRGIVHVRTIGYNQHGTIVCSFRRQIMLPTREHGPSEQPGRPEPQMEA